MSKAKFNETFEMMVERRFTSLETKMNGLYWFLGGMVVAYATAITIFLMK